MKDETTQKLKPLVAALRSTRGRVHDGYVLFLGGAASGIEGHPAIDELRLQVLQDAGFTDREISTMKSVEQRTQFNQIWSGWGLGAKVKAWQNLQTRLRPTQGHSDLALLLKENYFSLVLTTTIDPLMESVFISKTLGEGHPWSILVNGRDTQENIQDIIQSIDAKTTAFLKLCGDVQSGTFAVTQDEVKAKAQQIGGVLSNVLRRRTLIVVGFTPLDDLMLPSFLSAVERVIFISTEQPSEYSEFDKHNWKNNQLNYIIDPELNFDLIFQTIAERLAVFREVEQITGGKSLNEEELKRIDQAAEIGQTPQEALVQIIKTEQQRESGQAESPSIFTLVETTVLTVKVETNRQVSFEVTGGGSNYTSEGSREWNVNLASLNLTMQDMGHDIATYHRLQDQRSRDSWRRRAKDEGERLYKDLIESYPDLNSKLGTARQTADQNLTLVFNGPRDYLGMPYELLHDGKTPLVVSHPLCRKVSGVTVRHNETFDALVRGLRTRKQPLRLLLIASDAGSLATNQEITDLKNLIDAKVQAQQPQVRLKVEWTIVPAEKASIKEVRKYLTKCAYHIVHYAGHGVYDEMTGENSGLRLWQQGNLGKETVILSARELASLLVGSETRLFYLSACVGAWTGSSQLLLNNDYLGVMDALVQAGIPYVMGFRWYVTDSTSRNFAQLFYERLFTSPQVPEQAVFYARKSIYENRATDEAWTSPIFVAQNPYRSK